MKIRISLLTCPGRETFLRQTLESFDRARDNIAGVERIIYRDEAYAKDISYLNNIRAGWNVSCLFPEPQGNLRAFYQILRLAMNDNIDLLVYLEDDIVFCQNAIARMINVATRSPGNGLAFYNFFDMKEFFPGAPEGMYRVPLEGLDGRGLWGMQALAIPKKTIMNFFASPLVDKKFEEESGQKLKAHSDIVFAEALKERGLTHYGAHVPCLVEHVGHEDSAIWQFQGHEVSRRATNFRGENFDARQCKF